MAQTILVKELDRQLAEARAILVAVQKGIRQVQVLERERVKGAWRFLIKGQP